jgi:hypothetical protein
VSGVILRAVLVCHVLAAFAQSVFAGQFLAGSDSQVVFHEITGWALLAICALQIVLAAALLRSGITSLSLVFSSIFVFLAEGLQIGTGYGRFLNVHIPLGVALVAVVCWQTIVVFLGRTSAQGRAS